MISFLTFAETAAAESTSDSLLANTLRSYKAYLSRYPSDSADLSFESLSGWIADMMADGKAPSTYRRYAARLHTLYKEWRKGSADDPFADLAPLLNINAPASTASVRRDLADITRLLKRNNGSLTSPSLLMLLFMLMDPAITLEETINLKYADPLPDIAQIYDIVATMKSFDRSGGRARYIFRLNQGKQRPAAIATHLIAEIRSVMKGYGILLPDAFNRSYISALWIAAALKADVDPAEIRAILPEIPREYSYLRAIRPAELSDDEALRILRRVADTISDKTTRWYIMRLRNGINPDAIREAIDKNIPSLRSGIEYYYPTHTVTVYDRRRRKKHREEPYLPKLLFFRMRSDKVGRLFSKIGDKAWCYRRNADPRSPYCAISNGEMKRFQMHIGSFTPDIRMELREEDTEALTPGSKVRINGGGRMEGHIGEITAVKNTDGTHTYTLRLSSTALATWTVADLPALYLTPLP